MAKQIESEDTFVYEKSRKFNDISRDSRFIFNAWEKQEKSRVMYFSEAATLLINYVGEEMSKTKQFKDAVNDYNKLVQKHTYLTLEKFEKMILKLAPETVIEVSNSIERYDQLLLKSNDVTEREAGRKVTQYLLGYLRDLERF